MSLPSKSANNPLQDDELSDVTKREIIFWANKLKVTPSQLFALSKGELDALLENVIYGENSQQHDKQAERWERLSRMKQKIIESNQKDRLKGGLDLLEILCTAAQDIEEYLCQSAEANAENVDNDSDFPDSSGEEAAGIDEQRHRPSCPRRRNPNATYDVQGSPNATFNVPPNCPNATFGMPAAQSTNATFVMPAARSPNATFQIPPSPIPHDFSAFRPYIESTPYEMRNIAHGSPRFPNLSTVHSPSHLTTLHSADITPTLPTDLSVTYGSSSYTTSSASSASRSSPSQVSGGARSGGSAGRCPPGSQSLQSSQPQALCPRAPAASPAAWAPQQMNFISEPDGSPTYRNYTDYSITYGPCGSEETANSISVESFDEDSGRVTASARTFSLPPACSPTDALELSRISPPVLVERAALRSPSPGARARSPQNRLDGTYTPVNLASGCPRSGNRTQLSGVSPPQLASGAGGASGGASGGECSPPGQQQVARNPHLAAALRARTPMRQRPNRPYRPRRIC